MRKDVIGIIRGVDKLGRIVIPKEYRERYKLEKEVEIVATCEGVLVRSARHKVVFFSVEEQNAEEKEK
ncbi:MAG: hypothetical protein IKC87_02160 [Clostridia bacterium]|nr:hypothetical protein [Clostridia bacterium]